MAGTRITSGSEKYQHFFKFVITLLHYDVILLPEHEEDKMTDTKKTMQDYIASCPAYIRNNIENSKELTKPAVEEFLKGNYRTIWIVACGSSMNGSTCARSFIRRYLNCEVKIVAPFTFVAAENDLRDDDMVIIVSQSGYSLNALEAADTVRQRGRRCLALTGDLESDLARKCDIAANYGVGRETVAYVTRGVTTLALFFMLFALEAAAASGRISEEEASELKDQLRTAADINEQVQTKWASFLEDNYRGLSGMTNAYVCGVGANMGTAMEGALKFGETLSFPTAAYEIEEYIHGPNIQMTPRYSVFLIDGGYGSERIRKIYEGTRIVTDNAYLLTTDSSYTGDHVFNVPCSLPEEMTPLCFLPFFQLTAWKLTEDLNRWDKHPLQRKMEKYVSSKSENYTNSPFSLDTPGRQ